MLVKIASAGQSSVTLTSSGTASVSIYFFEFAGSHGLDQVSSGGAADSVILRLPSITPTAGSLVFGALGAVPGNSSPGQWAASPVINPAWRIISVNAGRCLAFAVSNVSAVNVSTTPPALSFPDIGLYGGGFAYSTFSLL
jgi:hypothetical protein